MVARGGNSLGGEGAAEVADHQFARLGRLNEIIGFRLRRIQMNFARAYANCNGYSTSKGGITSSLAIIAANPGISQVDLSNLLGSDRASIVALVDHLEKEGWAERRRSSTDRRRHALSITKSGAATLDEHIAAAKSSEMTMMGHLTPDEYQVFSRLLDRIFDAPSAD